MSFFEPVAAIARRQHGLITRAQLDAAGLTDRKIRTLVDNGNLVRQRRGLYVIAGSPSTWHQRLLTEVLAGGPDALAGMRAAAGLWRFHRYRRQHLDVVGSRWLRGSPVKGTGHETLILPSRDRTEHEGIPVTTPTRTLIDVGRYVTATQLGKMVDDAVTRDLTTYEDLHHRFNELARRGRDGIATIREVLDARPVGTVAPDSAFEDEVHRRLHAVGIEPVLHHRVACDGIEYVLDIAWPEYRVAVECDGFRVHRTEEQLVHDDDRQNQLTLAGWHVLRETWGRFNEDRDRIVREVRRALRARGFRND